MAILRSFKGRGNPSLGLSEGEVREAIYLWLLIAGVLVVLANVFAASF
jgi:hypothetical protein